MRFLLVVTIMMVSIALLALDMAMPHAQATSTPNSCASAIPSPVQGTPVPAPTAPGTLFINEVLTSPNTLWNCAVHQSPSSQDVWIELYNTQNQPVNLNSLYLSINAQQGNNPISNIPPGSVIAPHGFLVVFPLASSSSSELVITITSVQLMTTNTVIDSVSNIPSLQPDQSYARIPDGDPSGQFNWQISDYPTIGASNRLDPPTPAPTPTKTPKIRVHLTKTPGAKRSSSSSSSNQSNTTADPTSNSTDASLTNDGVQPSWHTLQFPGGTTVPSPALATVTPSSTTSPQQSANTSDLPKKIIISASLVVLAFALLWCWKHFLSP